MVTKIFRIRFDRLVYFHLHTDRPRSTSILDLRSLKLWRVLPHLSRWVFYILIRAEKQQIKRHYDDDNLECTANGHGTSDVSRPTSLSDRTILYRAKRLPATIHNCTRSAFRSARQPNRRENVHIEGETWLEQSTVRISLYFHL